MRRILVIGLVTLAALLASAPACAVPLTWQLSIDRIDTGSVILNDISASNSSAKDGQAEIQLKFPVIEMTGSEFELGPFLMNCPGSTFQLTENYCRNGAWSLQFLEDWPQVQGVLLSAQFAENLIELKTRGNIGELVWEGSLNNSGESLGLTIELPSQPLTELEFLKQHVAPLTWITSGEITGVIKGKQDTGADTEALISLGLSGIDFDSPDGLYAGAGVTMEFLVEPGSGNHAEIEGELVSGELLLQDFYRDFSDKSLRLDASAAWSDSGVELTRFGLTDEEALQLTGQATFPFSETQAPELVLREFHLEFPLAFDRYLQSTVSILGLAGLRTDGSVSWAGDWSPGSARNGELMINNLSIVDEAQGRFRVEGLDGQLLTGTESRVTWESLSFEKMNLGSGAAGLELLPEKISLTEPLVIDVLGGRLGLEAFSFSLPRDGDPDVQLQASIDNIEMLQMSRSMGWPEFGGTLSGSIPGVRWSSGVIEIDGALDFGVFDGSIELTDLRIERPFGVLPSMAANITAKNLDLEMLTGTFEFGRIGGRAEGYVHDLRMLNWQPVQFDAWFGTPVDDGEPHGISRKAVQHLTTIGGGSATAMLSGPILRLFNNFSYNRLGLGCKLRNNVCQIRGIEEQGEAVLLLEGAGLPKINIQAYNRSVDWPQLLAELLAVSSGEDIRIGDQNF